MRNQRLKRLEDLRLKLFEELEVLSNEKLNSCIDGKWSINQILYHLWLAEASSEQYIRTKTKYPDYLVSVSPLTYLKSKIVEFLLGLGIKFKAPQVVSQFPKKIDLQKLNEQWRKSRKSFDELILVLKEKNLDNKAIFKHGLLGRINLKLTLDFFDFHFKHHQKAINLLKK
ncbi:uncharacterized protein METZ01_LOCUS127913 [marine metagenome]|uniref:DinB-like domain-containing protein n=1 Tax=marine metagenome TaxID=408172 RepID=A0A381YDA7_9ZZZZ